MEEKAKIEEGMTFADLFKIIKKGWKTILVCVLIALILSTVVLITIRELSTIKQYESSIKFSDVNIRENSNWNTSVGVEQVVKSDTVVRDALSAAGFTKDQQDEMIKGGFISRISVETVEVLKGTSGIEYPYIMSISLKKSVKNDLSKAQCASIVDALVRLTLDYITKEFEYKTNLISDLAINSETDNYLEIVETLSSQISAVEAFCAACDDNIKTFKSTDSKSSILELQTAAQGLSTKVKALKLYLMDKAVANNSATVLNTEKSYSEYMVLLLTEETNMLQQHVTEYATLLQNCKPEINIYASADVNINDNYYSYLKTYTDLQEQLSVKKVELSTWEQLKTAYAAGGNAGDAENIATKAKITDITKQYKDLVDKLNATVKDYNDVGLTQFGVEKLGNAILVEDCPISVLIIVACDFVVLILTAIVAIHVVRKKEEKNNK